MLTERVAAFVAREHLLSPGQKVVVGVSGGPDSLCVLGVLASLGFPILVAHFDHRLRRDSWRDAQFVLKAARRFGLPAVVERARRGWLASGVAVEQAARNARYQFLVREARRWGAAAIATGHTADDQAETILMHLLRGTGIHGLRGMIPRTDLRTWASLPNDGEISLVRPLLATTRDETEAYCREHGFRPRRDPTNLDRSYFRNRLRHELIPTLRRYNPRIREVLLRTGEVMRREAEMVEAMIDGAAPGVMTLASDRTVRIHRPAFLSHPAPVRSGLAVRAARLLVPDLRDFGFEALDRMQERLEATRRGRRTPLPNGLEMIEAGDEAWLVRLGEGPSHPEYPQLESDEPVRMAPGTTLGLMSGWSLVAEQRPAPPEPPGGGPNDTLHPEAWLDLDRIEGGLTVRPPRPGERMQPLGMAGHRKLSEVFNTMKIPASARRRWPVVTCREVVVWLVGLRADHASRLTTRSRAALVLRLERREETGDEA